MGETHVEWNRTSPVFPLLLAPRREIVGTIRQGFEFIELLRERIRGRLSAVCRQANAQRACGVCIQLVQKPGYLVLGYWETLRILHARGAIEHHHDRPARRVFATDFDRWGWIT